MPFLESVEDIGHPKLDCCDLAGDKRLRIGKTVPIFATERLPSYQLLKSTHSSDLRVRRLVRINIDELNDEIGIGS